MTDHLRKFLLNNFIALVVIGILGVLLFSTLLLPYYHFIYPVVLVLSGAINVLIYFLLTRKEIPAAKSSILISQSFAIKFFYYLTVATLFIFFIESQSLKITFVLLLFMLYFVFTLLEVSALLRFFKSKKNIS
jgi:hypothetical protein